MEARSKCLEVLGIDADEGSFRSAMHSIGQAIFVGGTSLATIRRLRKVVQVHQPDSDPNEERLAQAATVPASAEYVLHFMLRQADRAAVLGDLEEQFRDLQQRYGDRKARVWYYAQVSSFVWPLVTRVGGKLVRWGGMAWAVDVVRRWLA